MTAPLFGVHTDAGRPDFGPDDVDALADDLLPIVGPRGISPCRARSTGPHVTVRA